jgi:Rrf2 family transcriptional regulator, cysteine metabolism repressor
MKLSSKGEYGLLALVDLAMHSGQGPVQIQQIARRQRIPKQYLDQLMLALKKTGLAQSSRGRQGGYSLARPAASITILDVVTALEGPISSNNFLSKGRRATIAREVLKSEWEALNAQSISTLRKKTIEDICNECRAQETAPMYYI